MGELKQFMQTLVDEKIELGSASHYRQAVLMPAPTYCILGL
jgi:hypothetical protein